MKRILYDVPKWHVLLRREAAGIKAPAADDDFRSMLADEVFDRLYTGESEPGTALWKDEAAEKIHAEMERNPEFRRLANQVAGDAMGASIAVDQLLEPVLQALDADDLRRRTTAAAKAAQAAAVEHEELMDAAEGVCWTAGKGPHRTAEDATRHDVAKERELARTIRDNHRLKRILALAGRFKRMAAAKRRAKVKHGSDEVQDIEQGADLARLLPVELGRLKTQRLAFFRDFTERQTLQYRLEATESKVKGPLVVCLDKSGSMTGAPDEFATAVALALLDQARAERRAFALVCFTGYVTYKAVVKPGGELPMDALMVAAHGGTSIYAALLEAHGIIERHPGQIRKADIVLVTDGCDSPSAPEQAQVAAWRSTGEVSTYGIAIGCGASAAELAVWGCDEASELNRLDLDDGTATNLFGRSDT